MKTILIAILTFVSVSAQAVDPIRIEFGKDYNEYSDKDLRRRVWQLEKAVAQLQDQVFQLALNKDKGGSGFNSNDWTCQISSFGKTHVASGRTKASALAQVLKKCADASNAIHCNESSVSCDNE